MEPTFDKDDLLGRWLGGSLSPQEEAELRARPEFAEYERLVDGVSELNVTPYDTEASLARLKAARTGGKVRALNAGAKQRRTGRTRQFGWLAAAASVLLLLSVWMFWPSSSLELMAAAGTQEKAELPDGSSITLNAGSTLEFSTTDDIRTAELNGEAFFDVQKDGRSFVVNTPTGSVTVLGTSFNVYSRGEDLRVSCRTGRVRVRFSASGEERIITAGQSVNQSATAEVTDEQTATDENLDWLAGRSVFNARPIAEVIAELERQFDLQIESPAGFDGAQTISTVFPNDNAEAALDIVVGSLDGLTYVRTKNKVILQ